MSRGSLKLASEESLELSYRGSLDQSTMQVARDALSSEGEKASSAVGGTTTIEDMMGLETDPSGGSRSTSLTKREC
jgi:hypothetical protein